MESKSNFPFPQADDFNKVISIINIDEESKLPDKPYISRMLGDVSDRQVQYYLSACQYLGIITVDKKFTELGNRIRSFGRTQQFVQLARIIASDEIFGTVYFSEKIFGYKLSREDVIDVMRSCDLGIENEESFKRRAQTVIKWIEWINDNFN